MCYWATKGSQHTSFDRRAQTFPPAGRDGQAELCWQGEPRRPALGTGFCCDSLSPRHGKSPEEGAFLRTQAGVSVFPSELEGSSFSHPPFIRESKEPIYPTPAASKKISLVCKGKGRKRSKDLCMSMAGVLHSCRCKLAVFEAGQASIKIRLKWWVGRTT